MKAAVFVYAVFCLATINLFGQPDNSAAKQESNPAAQAQASRPPQDGEKSDNHAKAAHDSPPSWYTSSEWWLVIIAALTGAAIAYQAREMTRATKVMEGQLKEMESAGKQTAAQLELTHRPWLAIDQNIVTPLTFDSKGLSIIVRFTLKNVGNSPAMKVVIYGNLESNWSANTVPAKLKALCWSLKDDSGLLSLPHLMGITLFPNDVVQRDLIFTMTQGEIDAAVDPEARKFLRLTIIGCADYQFSFADGHHQTPFAYDLRRYDASNPNFPMLIDATAGTLPIDGNNSVRLTRHIPSAMEETT